MFKNKSLEYLDIGFNNIKTKGAKYLIDKMIENQS